MNYITRPMIRDHTFSQLAQQHYYIQPTSKLLPSENFQFSPKNSWNTSQRLNLAMQLNQTLALRLESSWNKAHPTAALPQPGTHHDPASQYKTLIDAFQIQYLMHFHTILLPKTRYDELRLRLTTVCFNSSLTILVPFNWPVAVFHEYSQSNGTVTRPMVWFPETLGADRGQKLHQYAKERHWKAE